MLTILYCWSGPLFFKKNFKCNACQLSLVCLSLIFLPNFDYFQLKKYFKNLFLLPYTYVQIKKHPRKKYFTGFFRILKHIHILYSGYSAQCWWAKKFKSSFFQAKMTYENLKLIPRRLVVIQLVKNPGFNIFQPFPAGFTQWIIIFTIFFTKGEI